MHVMPNHNAMYWTSHRRRSPFLALALAAPAAGAVLTAGALSVSWLEAAELATCVCLSVACNGDGLAVVDAMVAAGVGSPANSGGGLLKLPWIEVINRAY